MVSANTQPTSGRVPTPVCGATTSAFEFAPGFAPGLIRLSLLADALARAARSEIAAYALRVDAKDDSVAAFCRHHGFIASTGEPLALFLPLAAAAVFSRGRSAWKRCARAAALELPLVRCYYLIH